MYLDHAYVGSDAVSRLVGTYAVNPLTNVCTVKFRYPDAAEGDAVFTMKFYPGYSISAEGKYLHLNIVSFDAPFYRFTGETWFAFKPRATELSNGYSMPMENQKKYEYRVDPNDGISAKEAALKLATLYMEDMMTESPERTFYITRYEGLGVELLPTVSMSEVEAFNYGLKDSERADNSWIVEIRVRFQYEGVLDPAGPGVGQWMENLHQGSPVGFLLTYSDGVYTMQSRTGAAARDTITDIADWDKLPWVQEPYESMKRAPNVYKLIYNLVSGESEVPEYNGLGIKDYSITLLENPRNEATFRFTFTVTGNSLPETLPPGTYTWKLYSGMNAYIQEGNGSDLMGLEKYGSYSAVQAVNKYMWFMYWEVPFDEWGYEPTSYYQYPYNYICAFYGGENMTVSFPDMQRLLFEKFGITVERPTESGYLYRCFYDKDTDTVRYADTRGIERFHRFLDVTESDGVTNVTVQLYADRFYLLPSHKIVYRIGEGEVFLGCEVIEKSNYEPYGG